MIPSLILKLCWEFAIEFREKKKHRKIKCETFLGFKNIYAFISTCGFLCIIMYINIFCSAYSLAQVLFDPCRKRM